MAPARPTAVGCPPKTPDPLPAPPSTSPVPHTAAPGLGYPSPQTLLHLPLGASSPTPPLPAPTGFWGPMPCGNWFPPSPFPARAPPGTPGPCTAPRRWPLPGVSLWPLTPASWGSPGHHPRVTKANPNDLSATSEGSGTPKVPIFFETHRWREWLGAGAQRSGCW